MIFEAFFVIFTVVKLKSTDDVLQGVNKLDYFIKASVFQVYKKNPNERSKSQMSINEDSEFLETF